MELTRKIELRSKTMPRYHNINGVKVQFTAEEETARDAEDKAWADEVPARALAELRNKRNNISRDRLSSFIRPI